MPPAGRPRPAEASGGQAGRRGPAGIGEARAGAPLSLLATCAARAAPEKEGPKHVL